MLRIVWCPRCYKLFHCMTREWLCDECTTDANDDSTWSVLKVMWTPAAPAS